MKYIYSTSQILKLSLTLYTFSITVKIVDSGLYFHFLFLEQLGLGFISHAVTSVTS